jgi:small subunit ribosomal protein S33
MATYYPRKTATIQDLKREFGPTLATWDEAEEDRFEYIEE